ncbi:MAG TPA: hypothetical protein VFK88_03335 [Gallionella sp.]|nr:hypothetical protein [Gallionella sp.]
MTRDDDMLTLNLESRWYPGRWLLPAMLWPLHGALLCGVDSPWIQSLLFVHLVLFLLWQPLWRSGHKAGWSTAAFFVLAATAAPFWLNWWLIAIWLTFLFGLIGACVFDSADRWRRLLHLVVMVYLLTVLLLWVMPNLFDVQHAIEVGRLLLNYVLTALLVMYVLSLLKKAPAPGCVSGDGIQAVNYVRSLLWLGLLTLVSFGSVIFMAVAHLTYPEALLQSLFLTGFGLLVLGVFGKPWFGINGLQLMLSRYALHAGAPLESWVGRLAETAQREPDAAAYLRSATTLLAEIPWLTGLAWQSNEGTGQTGCVSKHEVSVREGGLQLKLYASKPPDLGALLQACLIAQLIACSYQVKLRSGVPGLTPTSFAPPADASVALDLKNVLQSLVSLSDLAQDHDDQSRLLVQQQIPQLVQCLELAVRQLQPPPV